MQIALKSDFLSTSHCLLYGDLPGTAQAEDFRSTVMRYSKLPATVIAAMEALPTNAHPMSVVMSAVISMGALHPDQNPALAGNSIYKDKGVQDTQIVRLLGAMPSIASYAYYRCVFVICPFQALSESEARLGSGFPWRYVTTFCTTEACHMHA
jgi:citrate synthase